MERIYGSPAFTGPEMTTGICSRLVNRMPRLLPRRVITRTRPEEASSGMRRLIWLSFHSR